jgi:hypothetical protein
MTQAGGTKSAAALRYHDKLTDCSDKPCVQAPKFLAKTQLGAFRFIKEAQPTEEDFVPLPLTPRGRLSCAGRVLVCEHWALSFYGSKDTILRMWSSLLKRFKENTQERYGTHIVELDIASDDGLSDEPHKQTGHVSLHEYETHAAFPPRAKRSEMLPSAPKPAEQLSAMTPAPPLSRQRVIKLSPKKSGG